MACAGDRAYVAWTDLVGGEWHAFVRSVFLAELQPSEVLDAGPARRYRVAVAATGDQALLAWQEGARIRLGRFQIDPDDGQLVPLSTPTMARRGKLPILDADGARVAIGFDRPVKGGPRGIDSLAVQGRDVVATMVVYYGGDAWDRHRLRSRDGGKTWTRSPIAYPAAAIPKDGLLVTRAGVKVAEAYTDGEYADRFDLRVRREKLGSIVRTRVGTGLPTSESTMESQSSLRVSGLPPSDRSLCPLSRIAGGGGAAVLAGSLR